MSTQYDDIHKPYYKIRRSTVAYIEQENVKEIVKPLIEGARVLDLACGSGFYSYEFLQWGATHVLGVDISPQMISQARLSTHHSPIPHPISFLVADCSIPTAYPGAPFSLIHAAWLINYAPNSTVLTNMFRTIALNLQDGGTFIAVLKPPTDNPAAFVAKERALRPMEKGGSGGLLCNVIEEGEEGCKLRVDAKGREEGEEQVSFECWYLEKGVYEGAAREAGLRGEVRWVEGWVPGGWLEGGEWRGGAGREEVESYGVVPHFGVMVVEKGGG